LGSIIAYGLTRGIATAPINVRCPKSNAHITRFRAEAGEVPNQSLAKPARRRQGRGLCGAGFDHALEFGAAVVGGGRAWFDERFDKLVAAREAVSLAWRFWSGMETSCSAWRAVETRR
jgi:hypothetical protein